MNANWPLLGITGDIGTFTLSPLIIAQTDTLFGLNLNQIWQMGLDGALALGILLLGYIAAVIVKSLVKKLLNYLEIDNRVVGWISGGRTDTQPIPIEEWVSSLVFWLVFIFAIVSFFDKLKLTAASQPLTLLLEQITKFLPKILGAGALLGLAWILASITKLVITRILRTIGLDQKLQQQVGDPALDTTQISLSETLGNALYWFIFLLFLPSVLSTLELQGTLQPIQQMLNQILLVLPNLLAAVLIGATGWLIAQIIRRIVTNLLAASGVDRLSNQLGLTSSVRQSPFSSLLGTVVYVLILLPTTIAALNALKIDAISGPAVSMLTTVLNTIPQIFTAGLILLVAYFLGRFVADIITNILRGIGFDSIFSWLGLKAPWAASGHSDYAPDAPTELLETPQKTPSEVVGIVALVGIMLFASVTAADVLKLPALTVLLQQILLLSSRILMGIVVFAVGLYLANMAFNLIASSGGRQSRILAHTARIAIIVLISAMALQQIGIASDIVNLAFGLLLGAIAVALGLAFGLGGKDIATEQIKNWLASFRNNK